jgi:hypothetical protein
MAEVLDCDDDVFIKAYKLKIVNLCDNWECCKCRLREHVKIYFTLDEKVLIKYILRELPKNIEINEIISVDKLIDIYENNPSCRNGLCDIFCRSILIDNNYKYGKYDLSKLKNNEYIKLTYFM